MVPEERIDLYLQSLERDQAFSGVVRITQGDAELYAGAFGYASRSWAIRNALDIRFDTASITKLFTAVAILQLIDRDLLSLDTRATEFLGLTDTMISPDVTIYHLLTHSSGIADDAEEEAGESYEELWKDRPNYSVRETRDFLPQFVHKPPNFAPGDGCRYNNCGYVLLGLMIEAASGVAYRDYVREHIFASAGMLDSDFLSMDRVNQRLAEGADPIRDTEGTIVGWKKNVYSYPSVGSPDAGANVTAADLDRFLRAVLSGRLLSPQSTKAFFTPQIKHGDHDGWTKMYGFGLWFFMDADGAVVCCEKEGINAGVSGALRYFPNDDITVVVLSNMENGVWAPVWEIHEMIVAGEFGRRTF